MIQHTKPSPHTLTRPLAACHTATFVSSSGGKTQADANIKANATACVRGPPCSNAQFQSMGATPLGVTRVGEPVADRAPALRGALQRGGAQWGLPCSCGMKSLEGDDISCCVNNGFPARGLTAS
ncbi:hypothetical protein BHE74_00005572 [Ensete ventricosum]|nr:hypothetical protein GW17_00032957 [Ensete ventricosum]RWW85722.1 hypothetical protein BHE74_00005572 [Ensete ventricosum]RZR99525.1 hypothetical protein BHM03_00029094 [Ensete ventricosum]